MPTKTQIQANYLLQKLKKQEEPEGGMLFFKELMQCKLDYTPNSIKRLERLFTQIRNKNITLEKVLSQPKHKNLLLTLSVYLGNYIGKHLGESPNWIDYHSFSSLNKDEIPKIFPFSLVAQFTYGVALPCGIIMEVFSNDFSLVDYVDEIINEILKQSAVNAHLPANTICNLYQKKIHTGKLIDNTIAYADLLKKIKLDYSLKSLEKIDDLLNYIKKKEKLTERNMLGKSKYEKFINNPEQQRFIYFIGCYIGMTAAQLAKTTAKWYNHKEMQEILNNPNYQICIEHNQVMLFNGGRLRLPLMVVTNALFDLNSLSCMSAVAFAKSVVRDNKENLTSYPIKNNNKTKVQDIPKNWQVAMKLAGQLAIINIDNILKNPNKTESGCPMSVAYNKQTKKVKIINHKQEEIESLIKQLMTSSHQENMPFNILSYLVYANLPTGRCDAIAIIIKVYGKQALTLELLLPYRHPDHLLDFAIFPLIHYQQNNIPDNKFLPALTKAFYEGSKNIKNSNKVDYWGEYYVDKHNTFAPAAWHNKPIETFDDNDSEIILLPIPERPIKNSE